MHQCLGGVFMTNVPYCILQFIRGSGRLTVCKVAGETDICTVTGATEPWLIMNENIIPVIIVVLQILIL